MLSFFEKVKENVRLEPNKRILADDTNPKGITTEQFWNISGKVYAYLKNMNIGKEDFVMICLPRGASPIIAQIGVWRAGAAFVLVEDTYAPERIEYIRTNCNCKTVIDIDAWETIQHLEPKPGYEKTDEHDAAFAVYTSGTTGNPKGVLHEYGNIERMAISVYIEDDPLTQPDDRFALVAPLNFIASVLIEIYGIYHNIFLYVVSYATTKNPLAIGMFIVKNRITGTFLTPSYIKKMNKKPPMLKFCIIGSEPANGVYLEGIKIHNFYLMSESGFAVTHFVIDKKYEETPVGNSEFGHEIILLDEQGNPVTEGEGEICFENKYVRGYIGLEDATAKAFKNGYYHTGDLAKRDENGNFIICGRLNDMVKINGNRVEPGEIENVAQRVLGLKSSACRIIDNGNRVFICVYYTDDIKVDTQKAQKDMQKYLPYYMIPSFFIHLDTYPTTKTGKLDRKNLPAPDFSEYMKDYVAPRTDVEKKLCAAFEKALQIRQVGIKDDFYELGGDSLGTIEVIGESGLRGLTATDIFRGHTVEKIAQIYEENYKDLADEDPDAINEEEKKKAHPLSQEQTYMVDYQLYTPFSTMYNLNQMVKLDKSVMDMSRLADSVNTAVKSHASLLTTIFFNEDGDMMQRYSPEKFEKVKVEYVSEAELEEIKKTLIKPFKIVDSSLVRIRIFETEEAGYFFMDAHHTVFDGTSLRVFFTNVMNAYAEQDLTPDYYYYVLSKREKQMQSEFYAESREYFEKRYSDGEWVKHISVDHTNVRKNEMGELFYPFSLKKEEIGELEDKFGISPNGFFMTAAVLATAIYERKPNILTSWIYNGRNDVNEMNTAGLLFRNLPVGVKLHTNMTMKELCEDVTEQINTGITHSCYPFVETNNSVVTDDYACVLYQDDIRNMVDIPGIVGDVELENKYEASQNIMDMEILNDAEHGPVLMLDYSSSLYDQKSIERFVRLFVTSAQVLAACKDHGDFTVKKLARKISKLSGEGGLFSENWRLKWLRK